MGFAQLAQVPLLVASESHCGGSGHSPHRCWGMGCSLPGKRNGNTTCDHLLPINCPLTPQPGTCHPRSTSSHPLPSAPSALHQAVMKSEVMLVLGVAMGVSPGSNATTSLGTQPTQVCGKALQQGQRGPHYGCKLPTEPGVWTKAGLGFPGRASPLQFNQCPVLNHS